MKSGVDFQEVMIREGYSPYFMKYGNAELEDFHKKYQLAEREAQTETLGVWDQIVRLMDRKSVIMLRLEHGGNCA